MVSKQELENYLKQINVIFEGLNKRIEALEKQQKPAPKRAVKS